MKKNKHRWIARLGLEDISITEGPNIVDAIIHLKISHENYNPNIILNDIALLKLKNHVPITSKPTILHSNANSIRKNCHNFQRE